MNWTGKWIWLDENDNCINKYVDFRREFCADKSGKVSLYISADSAYQIWVNGNCLSGNQYSDWPRYKTYNEFDISPYIKDGKNILAIKVHHIGSDFHTYAKGKPGVIFEVRSGNDTIAKSDNGCRCRQCRCFKSGEISKVTAQLGFNFQYDARKEDDWLESSYDDGSWQDAVVLAEANGGYWEQLKARPLAMLSHNLPTPAEVVSVGRLIRTHEAERLSKTMMADFLSPAMLCRSGNGAIQSIMRARQVLSSETIQPLVLQPQQQGQGAYIILDLGKEDVGLLQFDIDAPEGTTLDIAHGEHLDDLRVRAAIHSRNFADRYICKQGRQVWQYPFRRLGARYLEVHIPKVSAEIKIYRFSIIPVVYPFKKDAYFYGSDAKLNSIWEVSRRTLELCAHEHYEDSPWREQVLYGGDSRLQALFGYYAFGEYDMPTANWELMRKGARSDKLLELCSPGRAKISIPGFSLQWVMAVYELYLFSGRKKVIEDNFSVVCDVIEGAIERLTSLGVVQNSGRPEHWNFYEWTPGFEGIEDGSYSGQNGRLDAAYNLYLLGAIKGAVEMGKIVKNAKINKFKTAYRKIFDSFNNIFWDKSKGLYASFNHKGTLSHYSQLVQALAISEGLALPEYKYDLCEAVKNRSDLVRSELSSKLCVYEALLGVSDDNINYVLDDIRDIFGKMLERGATSLWETQLGADDFEGAGSLCHGWSSVFNYIAGKYLLGISPIEPGFDTFLVKPLISSITNASGSVYTPKGKIDIAWTKTEEELIVKLNYPEDIKPEYCLPEGLRVKFV